MSTPTLIAVMNRQRDHRVFTAKLRLWTEAVLDSMGCTAEVGIHLVGATEMAEVNRKFLQHQGSTDVITFDHGSNPGHLHGELYISVADAILQADQFNTTWQEELGRYIIHGLLHLHGEDDLEPVARKRMKKRENQLLRQVASEIDPVDLAPSEDESSGDDAPDHG
jgi:probable rRNA maturation factor